jgi:hypothetical protein
MSDNKNVSDHLNRAQVSTCQVYELSYLEKKRGKNRELVMAAIAASIFSHSSMPVCNGLIDHGPKYNGRC